MTARADAPILKLCRMLVAAGYDPATPLQAYRNGVPSISVSSIGFGAQLVINGRGTGFALRRGVRTAPPARPPEGGATPVAHPSFAAASDHGRTSHANTAARQLTRTKPVGPSKGKADREGNNSGPALSSAKKFGVAPRG